MGSLFSSVRNSRVLVQSISRSFAMKAIRIVNVSPAPISIGNASPDSVDKNSKLLSCFSKSTELIVYVPEDMFLNVNFLVNSWSFPFISSRAELPELTDIPNGIGNSAAITFMMVCPLETIPSVLGRFWTGEPFVGTCADKFVADTVITKQARVQALRKILTLCCSDMVWLPMIYENAASSKSRDEFRMQVDLSFVVIP